MRQRVRVESRGGAPVRDDVIPWIPSCLDYADYFLNHDTPIGRDIPAPPEAVPAGRAAGAPPGPPRARQLRAQI